MTRTSDVDISPRPSRVQLVVTSLIASLALVGLWVSTLGWPLQAAFSIAIVASAIHHSLWVMGRLNSCVIRIQQIGDDWWLTFADKRIARAELHGVRVVLPYLVSIHFDLDGESVPCTLLGDSLSSTEHRRLRQAVLMQPHAVAQWRLTVTRWNQYCIGRLRRS